MRKNVKKKFKVIDTAQDKRQSNSSLQKLTHHDKVHLTEKGYILVAEKIIEEALKEQKTAAASSQRLDAGGSRSSKRRPKKGIMPTPREVNAKRESD